MSSTRWVNGVREDRLAGLLVMVAGIVCIHVHMYTLGDLTSSGHVDRVMALGRLKGKSCVFS